MIIPDHISFLTMKKRVSIIMSMKSTIDFFLSSMDSPLSITMYMWVETVAVIETKTDRRKTVMKEYYPENQSPYMMGHEQGTVQLFEYS